MSAKYEVILVNDGSKDQTLEVIYSLCELNPNVKGVNLSKNFGQQQAMLAGFKFASGDLIVYCDDDGESPVKELDKFIEKIEQGYDMVWANYPDQKRKFFNRIGAYINNIMLKFIFDKPKDLNFGNMWIAKKFIIQEAIKCPNPKPYLGGVYLTITSNMANVQCDKSERLRGVSNYSYIKLIGVWLNGFTAFSIAPLRLASIIGFLTAIVGFTFMSYLIGRKLGNPEIVIGYSSIMSVILFVGGMLMIMIGMLGEYIGRIYINVNNVPQFVVKEKINLNNG
jgi:undecaprenyl-phosphate 4-deoxy-4-formamido-L-arabinose transferase